MSDKRPKQFWRRYLHLNGDPLHLPLAAGLVARPDSQITLGVLALAVGASWYMGADDRQVMAMAFNSAAGFAAHQAFERLTIERRQLAGHFRNAARYCIDKYPSEHSMVTGMNERDAATSLRTQAMLAVMFMALITPMVFADSFTAAASAVRGPIDSVWKNGLFGCAFWLSWMARNSAAFIRFNNVTTGKWNIIFAPLKPQTKDDTSGAFVPHP